jgi:hypothetical protein
MQVHATRVTRLSDFSPIRQLFTSARFFKLQYKPKNLGSSFAGVKLSINFDKKTGWATFWAMFANTHLVTLHATHVCAKYVIGQYF